MARHRRNDILDRLIERFSVRGLLLHQATLFVMASAAVIGGVIFLWQNHQSIVVDPASFQLTKDRIQVTTPPDWVEQDLKSLLTGGEPGAEPESILDPELVNRTAARIQSGGFVERVNRISKSRAGLEIELDYRRPVAVVELRPWTIPEWPEDKAGIDLPVDRNGVLMPETVACDCNLPKISMLYPAKSTQLTTWSDWPDLRVRQAAAVAGQLVDRTETWGVTRIVTFQKPDEEVDVTSFELWSAAGRDGVVILWGSAPGAERSGEVSADQKLVAIEALLAEIGAMDRPLQRRFDVRSGVPVESPQAKTAAGPGFVF